LFLFVSSWAELWRLRRAFAFDLIDAHFAYPDGAAAVLLGRIFRVPVTITLRGTIIPLAADWIRSAIADWALRRADTVIAVSEELAARARKAGVPAGRIWLIPNGVDTTRFAPSDRAEARLRLGLPEEGRILVSVGHLSPRKGFHRVIAALPHLVREFPDLLFAVVGGGGAEGDNRGELESLASALGVARRVRLAGPEPPDRVALWLNAANLFVLASDFEGCPNVVWEAMACGQPVVATSVGHVPHMVPPFAGIVFGAPDDAVLLLAALRQALTTNWDQARIRAHAEHHTWEAIAARVLARWRETAERRRKALALAPARVGPAQLSKN
jgi:teichuronic acid biosynthesis glycosyltransferase TuaC